MPGWDALPGLSSVGAPEVVGYPSLFVLVLFGSLVPVVPTGALVSGAAVVAVHADTPVLSLLGVLAVGALAAFCGDLVLYALAGAGLRGRGSGPRWLGALRARAAPERLARARRGLHEHGVTVLVVSRLVPAGRIPVMLACLLGGLPLSRFARGAAPAGLAWALAYGVVGIVGGTLFPEPWQGLMAAVLLALLIAAGPGLYRYLRRTPGGEAPG
ncbi:DedA family protein [Streptomyces sp. 549]|uniref:DedA family protein n=1 Tax=Streptomyces sp. 549 TaxID=3049076 RepID=UPI0024C3D582|nr:DedA family protein [Streptomyces sp. 549]MDK1472115.1 DedA family protein [Streptomyces sp. 549]